MRRRLLDRFSRGRPRGSVQPLQPCTPAMRTDMRGSASYDYSELQDLQVLCVTDTNTARSSARSAL